MSPFSNIVVLDRIGALAILKRPVFDMFDGCDTTDVFQVVHIVTSRNLKLFRVAHAWLDAQSIGHDEMNGRPEIQA